MTDQTPLASDAFDSSTQSSNLIIRGIRAHFSFAALLAILFLTFLDNTIASAVLTSVQAKLHANVSQLQWVVGGYALAFASLMLMCGRWATTSVARR
jgi:MFS family permease